MRTETPGFDRTQGSSHGEEEGVNQLLSAVAALVALIVTRKR